MISYTRPSDWCDSFVHRPGECLKMREPAYWSSFSDREYMHVICVCIRVYMHACAPQSTEGSPVHYKNQTRSCTVEQLIYSCLGMYAAKCTGSKDTQDIAAAFCSTLVQFCNRVRIMPDNDISRAVTAPSPLPK